MHHNSIMNCFGKLGTKSRLAFACSVGIWEIFSDEIKSLSLFLSEDCRHVKSLGSCPFANATHMASAKTPQSETPFCFCVGITVTDKLPVSFEYSSAN